MKNALVAVGDTIIMRELRPMKTAGGIELPQRMGKTANKARIGRVVAAGHITTAEGIEVPHPVKPGDVIAWAPYRWHVLMHDDVKYVTIPEQQLLGVVDPKAVEGWEEMD